MLAYIDLFEFEVIVAAKFGIASSHGIRSFQQVVTKETVAGLDQVGSLGFKVTGLVLRPNKTCILGNRSLRLKAADVADLSDDTGRVNRTDAGNGSQGIGNDFKLLFNGLFKSLDLKLHSAHSGDGGRHGLINRVVDGLGKTIRASCSRLNRFGDGFWIGETTVTRFSNVRGQYIQRGISKIVNRIKITDKIEDGCAGVFEGGV